MDDVLVVLLAYLAGSVPFAYLLSRQRGIDLRRIGSGNIGASNVLRTSGVRIAVLAMCLDALKGATAVIVAERVGGGPATTVAAGLASIVGHVYPIWLRFHGGKGVATAAGAFAVLAPIALGVASAVFLLAVWITRYISVGSITAALTVAIVAAASAVPGAVMGGAWVSFAIILHRHRANLARIVAGTERRVGQRRVQDLVS